MLLYFCAMVPNFYKLVEVQGILVTYMAFKSSEYLIDCSFSIGKQKLNAHCFHWKQVHFNIPEVLNCKDSEICLLQSIDYY